MKFHRQVNEVYFIHLPMKMEPIVSSETSAIRTQTPGNYPKRNKLHLHMSHTHHTTFPISSMGMRQGVWAWYMT